YADTQIVAAADGRQSADRGRGEDRHGRQDGTQVSAAAKVAQRAGPAARLGNAQRSVRRGLGGGVQAVGRTAWPSGQDDLWRVAASLSRPVRRRAIANLAAQGAALAGHGGATQGGVLRSGPRTRPAGGGGLHAHACPP